MKRQPGIENGVFYLLGNHPSIKERDAKWMK
jgi:hypothetical protein